MSISYFYKTSHFRKSLYAATLLLLISSSAFAQYRANLRGDKHLWQLSIDNWTTDQGLLSNTLLEVTQTPDGFLWCATYDGLVRFDGINFQSFGKKEVEGFKTNAVFCLDTAPDSTLWLGTHGSGLYSYKNGQFRAHPHPSSITYIQDVLVDAEAHSIWVGTRNHGCWRYDWKQGLWQQLYHPSLNQYTVNNILKDQSGKIWMATTNPSAPLVSYLHGDYQSYPLSDKEGTLQPKALFSPKSGVLWIGTDRGVYQYSREAGIKQVRRFPKELTVHSIEKDASDNIWVSSMQGLARWNPSSKKLEWLRNRWGKQLKDINDTFQGREGSVWIASYRKGLFRIKDGNFYNFHFTTSGIVEYPITAVGPFKKDLPLAGDSNGQLYTIEEGLLSPLSIQTSLSKGKIFQITQGPNGITWIATYQGLLAYNPKTKEERFYGEGAFLNRPLRVKCVLPAKNGDLWIGTFYDGLLHISKEGQLIQQYSRQENGFPANYIMAVRELPNGNIAVSSNGSGFIKIDPKKRLWEHWDMSSGLCSDLIFNSHTDLEGNIWLAANGGIAKIGKKGEVSNFTYKDGLPNDTPFDILEDALSNIWLTTGKGLIRVSKEDLNSYANGEIDTLAWEQFAREDGIHYEQCTGASFSWIDPKNNLWVPSIGGLTQLRPHQMAYNTFQPPVYIQQFTVGEEPIDMAGSSKPIITKGQKRYSFRYTALSLWAPSKIQFKYKLIGYDKEWVAAGNERMATYTNLPAGRYTFHVIACNNNGVWNKTGKMLSFEVKPRFYEHPLFLFSLILIGIFLIRAFYNWRMLRSRYRQQLLEKRVRERTREIEEQQEEITAQNRLLKEKQKQIEQANQELKLSQKELQDLNARLEEKVGERTQELETKSKKLENTLNRLTLSQKELDHFTYQAPHDFRGPIARLLGILQIARLDAGEQGFPYINRAEQVAVGMDVMLKKLLDAYELNRYQPIYKQIFLERVYQSAVKKLSKRFPISEYELSYENNGIEGVFSDLHLLLSIFENLLENAFSYTLQQPKKVAVIIEEVPEEGTVLIHVKDNGIGILPQFHEKVFASFFKASDISQGNGLGLYLVSKCLEKLEGTASIESDDQKGCTVSICLHTISSYSPSES